MIRGTPEHLSATITSVATSDCQRGLLKRDYKIRIEVFLSNEEELFLGISKGKLLAWSRGSRSKLELNVSDVIYFMIQ